MLFQCKEVKLIYCCILLLKCRLSQLHLTPKVSVNAREEIESILDLEVTVLTS